MCFFIFYTETKNIIIDKNKTLHYLSHNKKIRCFIMVTSGKPESPWQRNDTASTNAWPAENKTARSLTLSDKTRHPYAIQSVDNALDVLEALCTEGEEGVPVALIDRRACQTEEECVG